MNHGVKDAAEETTEHIGVSSFGGEVELLAEDKFLDCGCDSFFPYDICEKGKVGSIISIVFSAIRSIIRRLEQAPFIGQMVLEVVERDRPRRFKHKTLVRAVELVPCLDDISRSAKCPNSQRAVSNMAEKRSEQDRCTNA